jgi:hypothetical protein
MWWILLILFIVTLVLLTRNNRIRKESLDLDGDGVVQIQNVLSPSDIQILKTKCDEGDYKYVKEYLIQRLGGVLPDGGYQFQDYVWIIKKSSVHTCHRDNNGDFFNKGQKYPSYTLLVYLENMGKCLGVIPRSHKIKGSFGFNVTDPIENIACKAGDIILFNANLIHVGTLVEKDDNLRIQMKISHEDDIETLSYYENFNKVLVQENNVPYPIRQVQMAASCAAPFISDMTQNINKESARGTVNGAHIGPMQKLFSLLFYGNSNFYDLPNAF